MTITEELEMRIKNGTDLIFIHGLLTMAKEPETSRKLYQALHEIGRRLAIVQEFHMKKLEVPFTPVE